MNYKDYNDEELLMYVKEESEDANTILCEKYKPLVLSIAQKHYFPNYNLGIELSDLVQEGFLGLNTAIHHYNDRGDNKFFTFAKKCIERNIVSLIVGANRKKYKALNESLSLNVYLETNQLSKLEKSLFNKEDDPLIKLMFGETKEDLFTRIKNELTNLELKVLLLKIEGLSCKQISKEIGKDSKCVNNAIARIRKKIKKAYYRT